MGDMRCPNCAAKVAVKSNGECVCAECGGTFQWKAGDAKLTGAADWDAVKSELAEIRKSNAELRALLEDRQQQGDAESPKQPKAADEEY